MGVKVTNNAFGTLLSGISSSATTITLDSGQGAKFPTLGGSDFFFATLIDTSNNLEIVKITARSTDSLTAVRAQDNTSARAFSAGDRIELRPTAAMFESLSTPDDATTSSKGIASFAAANFAVSSGAVTVKDLGITAAKFNADVISGQPELASEPADTDEFLVSDAGVLKRIDYSLIKGGGKVLQSLSTAITAATGTTTIPNDNTTPTSSEGTEFFSQAITPASSSNKILITGAVSAENSAGNGVVITVFRGSTCIASYVRMEAVGTVPGVMAVHVVDAPSTTSATTYSCRIGGQGAGTWAVARRGTAVYNGTMAGATFTVQEIDGT